MRPVGNPFVTPSVSSRRPPPWGSTSTAQVERDVGHYGAAEVRSNVSSEQAGRFADVDFLKRSSPFAVPFETADPGLKVPSCKKQKYQN